MAFGLSEKMLAVRASLLRFQYRKEDVWDRRT